MSNLNDILHIKNQLLKSKNKEINALQVKVKALTKALEVEVAGSSCCEEAQLTANELARRNEELAEAQDEIAALSDRYVTLSAERNSLQRCLDSWRVRAEKAEAERDELQAKLDAAESHVVTGGKTPKWMRDEAERLIRLELGSAVSDVRGTAEKVLALTPAAENRPTLDREAVQRIIEDSWEENGRGELEVFNEAAAVDAIMALTEQAATGDEDQRVKDQAKALYNAVNANLFPWASTWEDQHEEVKDAYAAAIRAGWTPPNPVAEGYGYYRATDGGRVESEDEQ